MIIQSRLNFILADIQGFKRHYCNCCMFAPGFKKHPLCIRRVDCILLARIRKYLKPGTDHKMRGTNVLY